jgi:predicted nucleotidyltransferase
LELRELPSKVQEICTGLVGGLKEILGGKLYGIYLYGAAVFPDSGPVSDIDCHVILNEPLDDRNREAVFRLYARLKKDYPPLGQELDIWYILFEDAQKAELPQNQLKTNMSDEWWALHCAHIRADRYVTLYGPEPDKIFPVPSWEGISAALDHEIEYIKNNLKYPAYCVLNLCRIIYSFRNRDVVVSKCFSGLWAIDKFPAWVDILRAALRTYEGKDTNADKSLLRADLNRFLEFGLRCIDKNREVSKTDAD